MAAQISPLRAFRSSRSPLCIRSISTKPAARAAGNSAGSKLIEDLETSIKQTRTPPAARTKQGAGNASLMERLSSNYLQSRARNTGQAQANETARLTAIARTARRNWQAGDVYAPHDLSAAEARKWRLRRAPTSDKFDQLAIDPMKEWKNVAMMYEFQTTTGRIKPRNSTGLRPVNQRKIARAIRRGIGMGFLPSVHAHPEILRRESINFNSP